MSKNLKSIKRRLEEAMSGANEAEEIIPLLKEAIAKFELMPGDLFEDSAPKAETAQPGKYRDGEGNTWGGKGRRPKWLAEALSKGKSLDDFLLS